MKKHQNPKRYTKSSGIPQSADSLLNNASNGKLSAKQPKISRTISLSFLRLSLAIFFSGQQDDGTATPEPDFLNPTNQA